MIETGSEALVLTLRSDEDLVKLRQSVREVLVVKGFRLVDQTKLVTAASELARNTLKYGGGGEAQIRSVAAGARQGVSMSFIDSGPGIPNVELAMNDGYTTGGGLGLGLSGSKRLCDEFEIQSVVGEGTTVRITKWKPY